MAKTRLLLWIGSAAALVMLIACTDGGSVELPSGGIGVIQDEAMFAGRSADSFPGSDDEYLRDMDGGLGREEVQAAMSALGLDFDADEAWSRYNRGRNNWAVWTGGNDRFWDEMANVSYGALDLLKTVSSHPDLPYGRGNRWAYLGLVNEPCFSRPTGPDPDRYGLWLDVRDPSCPPDPFADAERYPGVEIGARGRNIPVGSYYGEPSGIFGLRLFPNPKFDEEAQAAWDPERYYTDSDYYNDPDLVRPYRVGMTCGFCHVGPDPDNPPADHENPTFANLNNNPGAQYFWVDRILVWEQNPSSFAWQLFHTSEPGALDTSFISTDSINNPRTMNAVYSIGARLRAAARWGRGQLEPGGSANNRQFNDYPEIDSDFLLSLFEPPSTVFAPHVLKDGADSVGVLGALNRVYLNIGLFSEEWLQHFRALVGGKRITPIEIEVARRNSAMWNANEMQTQDVALFFAVSAVPDHLASAPGGEAYLTDDEAVLTRGKTVFAERCARCHSSKIPEPPSGVDELDWDEYWAWSKTEDFKAAMTEMVLADDFLEDNFLSTEKWIPVTLLGTNACASLATNGLRGNIWDNFTSESYKNLPSVGTYRMQHPITGEWRDYEMPAGGRGYIRPPSLISLWSSAPFGLSNSVGRFRYEATVEARMDSFDDSIGKWLWPETRRSDVERVRELGLPEEYAQPALEGYVYRTTATSYATVPLGYLPDLFQDGPVRDLIDPLVEDGYVRIGPIPAGTPINLIANLRLLSEDPGTTAQLAHARDLARLVVDLVRTLRDLPQDASDEAAREAFAPFVDRMIALSTCPDFVVNRGHYFGTDMLPASEGEPGLSDDDKRALIEFLKTF